MFFCGISDEAGSTIERQIAAHQELGWTALELRMIGDKNLTFVDDATFDHVVAAVEAAGMRVASFASAVGNWSRLIGGDFQVCVDELARAIPRMHQLQTPFIRVMSWTNKEKTHDEASWRAEAIRRMTVLARMAEDGGITMIHENCDGWGGDSPENTIALLEEVDSPALRTVFDTGNPFMHHQNALEYLQKTIHLVSHVHIKDGYLGAGGKHMFTYPNEGSCQVKACLRTLIEYGYDGGYSIEPHVAAIIHTGEGTGANMDETKYNSYLEYGRRLMRVYAEAEADAKAMA